MLVRSDRQVQAGAIESASSRPRPFCDIRGPELNAPKRPVGSVPRQERRLNAHGLIAKILRTRRWRVTSYGRNVTGTSLYLREHRFATAYPMSTAAW